MNIWMIMSGYREAAATNTGAELQADTLLKELGKRGHHLTVIAKKHTWQSKRHEFADHIEVFRVGPPGLRSLITAWLLWRNRQRIDLVHIHGQDSLGVFAIGCCYLLGIPTLLKITIAGRVFVRTMLDKLLLLPRKWRIFRRLTNRITRLASAYIAISREIAAELPRAGFLAENIVTIPNGVNIERFHPVQAAEKAALARQLNLPPDRPLLLYASRLVERKGFDLLLQAWPKIHACHPNAHLVIVGAGQKRVNDKIAFLARRYAGAITYVGQVNDTAPYLKCADIFIFPSRKEGLPNALLEAMACGCSIVASDIGGCRDLIVSGRNGILFPAGDAEALAEQTNKLLSEPAAARSMGACAAQDIAAGYDIKVVAGRIEQLYQSLVTDKNKYINNTEKQQARV